MKAFASNNEKHSAEVDISPFDASTPAHYRCWMMEKVPLILSVVFPVVPASPLLLSLLWRHSFLWQSHQRVALALKSREGTNFTHGSSTYLSFG